MGSLPKFSPALTTWVEAGVVNTKKIETPNMEDRGTTCMFVGYNNSRGAGVYHMWNPKTNRFHRIRDIICINQMY